MLVELFVKHALTRKRPLTLSLVSVFVLCT